MTHEDTIQLESFELTVDQVANIELDKLHALSIGVGWPHRPKDWQMLRSEGHGVVAIDDIGRLAGSAMWFDFGSDFSTIGMVITPPKLQSKGTGRWLMEHVMDQTAGRRLGLNATRAAKRLYHSLGFSPEGTVYQCQGEAVAPKLPEMLAGAILREAGPSDLAEMATLDARAYGADRTVLLSSLMAVSKMTVLVRANRIEAFAFCRPFGRGSVVGPVIAFNDADAIAVANPHVADHLGEFLRLDTRQQTGAFAQYLIACGLPVFDTVTTMSLGGPWISHSGDKRGERPVVYALASQAFG